MQTKELKYTQLNNFCNPKSLGFESTDEIEPLEGIIGQDRAVNAFNFGLKVKNKGYNIYMAGPSGVGKTTYAEQSTKKIAQTERVPYDWCYVYNFDNPRNPLALRFEPGIGRQFKDDMNELVVIFESEIQKAFNSEDYEKQKNEILKVYDDRRDELMKNMSDIATEHNFTIKSTNAGIYFMPIVNGESVNEEQYDKLSEDVKEKINKESDIVQDLAASIMRDIKDDEKECRKAIDDLDYKVGMFAIGHHVSSAQEKYKHYDRVMKYIEAVQEDVLENINQFAPAEPDDDDTMASLLPLMISKKAPEDVTLKYKVNLIIDNSKTNGAPVVIDFNPTYYNLMGELEYDNEFGNLTTDFMKIKAGLFHKANGGYLILQAHDVLSNVQSWEAIHRVVKTREISMESIREQMGGVLAPTLRPEPIPVNVKVIMIGSTYYYEMLREYEDDFDKYFKILADFDYEMNRSKENINQFARFIKAYTVKEKMMPFDAMAVSKIVEYTSRLVESQNKLSTRFNCISEILCEAETWATMAGDTMVTAEHIKKTIFEKEKRLKMYEEKLGEMLEEEVIMIDTCGSKIGQINGLAVLDMGSYAFGNPSRITATTYIGKSGIVNIEKESHMSGPTHNKGVQVITGYLGNTYAQEFPLSLSCRICFEQNYNGIDGDSASSTELYCILSSLAEVPINQELAVTGSVNQRGEIQAIGGVTHKIEGFFDLCNKRGLTGGQGVIIPSSNISDLVLKEDVIEAVKESKFHIYPITHIDEGIEILTGVQAGKLNKNSKYPPNSIKGLVSKKLREYYKKVSSDGTVRRL
ncbi:MAG TPA: ATP-dependent protease [Lachnospiraceae bacterium]|nr:ATP-dependent protease [Lachnospiraceae bacterium]